MSTPSSIGEEVLAEVAERKRGTKPELFTPVQVADALSRTAGIYTQAAKQLGCARQTVANYVERYPDLMDVVAEARERVVDLAESNLVKGLQNGCKTMTIFTLKTQGARRGWIEHRHQHHTGSHPSAGGGRVFEVRVVEAVDPFEIDSGSVEALGSGDE